jgi:hypothetical protein
VGGLRRPAAAGPLPHRGQPDHHDYFGTYPWESQDEDTKLAIGGTLLFIGNARVVTNII